MISMPLLAIGQRPQQHRHADPGDAFDPTRLEQLERQVARRCPEHVGHHQHPLATIDLIQQQARERQNIERIVLRGDTELGDQRRTLVENVTDVLDQAFAKRTMRYQKNADHRYLNPG
jgi:hypothetical protein